MTRATLLRSVSTILLTAFLTVGHLFYSWRVSLLLYQQSGGIHKLPNSWTEFDGAPYAWTIPLQLPGSVLLQLCQLYRHDNQCLGFVGISSLVLLLLASAVTAYAIAAVVVAIVTRHQFSLGRFYWRAVVIILGLTWIPVRQEFALVYHYTVLY